MLPNETGRLPFRELPPADQVKFLLDLIEIGREAALNRDPQSMFRAIRPAIARIVPFDRISILGLEPAEEEMRVYSAYTHEDELDFELEGPLPLLEGARQMLATGRGIVDPASSPLGDAEARYHTRSMHAYVAVPMLCQGRVVGFMTVASWRPETYTEADVPRLQAVADQIAPVLESARLSRETRRSAELFSVLNEIAHGIVGVLDIDRTVAVLRDPVRRLLDFDLIVLSVPGHLSGTLVHHALHTDGRETSLGKAGALPIAPSGEDAFLRAEGQIVDLTKEDSPLDRLLRGEGFVSRLIAPLVAKERRIGLLSVASTWVGAFSPADVPILQRIADQIAPAVDAAQIHAEAAVHESRWRDVVDNSPEGILVTQDLKVVYANPAAQKIYGARTPEQFIGRKVLDQVHPDDRRRVLRRIRAGLARSEAAQPRQQRNIRLDGRAIDVEVSAITMLYEGRPARLAFVRDVTARKRLEEEISRRREEAARLRERERLAGEIHDTLAQQFVGIGLHLQGVLVDSGTMPAVVREQVARAVDLAREGHRQARALIRGQAPPELAGKELSEGLHAALDDAGRLGGWRGAFILRGRPVPLPEPVKVAVLRIGQEALNNAVKHARATLVSVSLSYWTGRVSLVVQDNGVGFEPGRTPRTDRYGLAGMRRRTEEIKGDLRIVSRPGAGTSVRVTVPLAEPRS